MTLESIRNTLKINISVWECTDIRNTFLNFVQLCYSSPFLSDNIILYTEACLFVIAS